MSWFQCVVSILVDNGLRCQLTINHNRIVSQHALIVLRELDSVRVYHGSAGSALLRNGFHCQVSSMSTKCFQRACPGIVAIVSQCTSRHMQIHMHAHTHTYNAVSCHPVTVRLCCCSEHWDGISSGTSEQTCLSCLLTRDTALAPAELSVPSA